MYHLLVTSAVVGFTVFLICAWLVRRPKNLPPGPASVPLLGYVQKDAIPVYQDLTNLSRKYGPIFSFRKGIRLVVVLNDKHSIMQALVKNADIFSDRFIPAHILHIPKTMNGTPVWSSGEQWRELRRFGSTSLRHFGMGKKSLAPQINHEARYLCEELQKSQGSPIFFQSTLNNATGNIISFLSYGRRYEYDDNEYHGTVDALFSALTALSDTDPAAIFPILLKTPWYKEVIQNQATVKKFIMSHIHTHQESFQEDNLRDMTDAFLADNLSKVYTLEEFWRIAVDFFAAGTGTTSSVLSWIILFLSVDPDKQKKVHAELDSVVGRSRQPVMADRPNLPYCEATIYESLRMRPPLPIAIPHKTAKSVTFESYTIPKGTTVLANLWAVHHDPEEWENPDVFDPERFLTDDGRKLKKSDAWMPFGVGRRECVGAHLAKMETFLFFTNIFQRFEFKLPHDQPKHSMHGVDAAVIPPEAYRVCAIER